MRRIVTMLLVVAALMAVPSVAHARSDHYIGFGRPEGGFQQAFERMPRQPRTNGIMRLGDNFGN